MLRLYTDANRVDKSRLIRSNNGFFMKYVLSEVLNEKYRDLVETLVAKYDNSVLTDKSGVPKIRTRHGFEINPSDLSTGLKTLLNSYYILHNKSDFVGYTLDVTECGKNLLLDIFLVAEKAELELLLRHTSIPHFEGFDILVDGDTVINNKHDLIIYYMKRFGEVS